MGNFFTIEESNFSWLDSDEPHKLRRIEILKKHPEIKKLMKCQGDRRTVIKGVVTWCLHLLTGYLLCTYVRDRFVRALLTYAFGSWFATALLLHVHEAVHGLSFGVNHVWKNIFYGHFINLALAGPFFPFFRRKHKSHHKYIGDEVLDGEYPSEFEAKTFGDSAAGKYAWFLANPSLIFVRVPLLVVKKYLWELTPEEFVNVFIITSLHVAIGFSNLNFLAYILLSSWFAAQTNMFGFWGICVHVEYFKHKETSSYYGWMNKIFLNFGYHMEHHDFPNVPSSLLPEIKRLAPEYYEDSFAFDSFYSAAIKYIFDRKYGIRSRVKRENNTPWKYATCEGENFRKFQK